MNRLKVKDCYMCSNNKKKPSDYKEASYECDCGHLFTVQNPSKQIFIDGKFNNFYR